ncbi:endoglucanase [Daldinia childiae]|uniref:endoglucanase n=1 Tax=Daldinia childiae TaxID=326645 RepID=UPI001447B481|nr:endoglucanase [Daldinia childiae]KAF3061138.1 endoglucanase [Daldinia childiae]
MHRRLLNLAAFSALFSPLGAHVVLENPKPFRFVQYGPTNPISSTGEDFPCKIPAGGKLEPEGPPTTMAIGDEQSVSFSGQAVHGGGSCQFSLSGPVSNGAWETYPLKTAEWKVIHSIEGGCPARNQRGNLDGPNHDSYSVNIPEGIEPGDYIFAWTWLARIGGQPEYYMNCAPITVTPAKRKRMDSLARRASLGKRAAFPELFMANMGDVSGGCTTEEALQQQIAIAFPNPGPSVDYPEGSENLFKQQCDGNPLAGQGNIPGTPDISTSSQPSPTFIPEPKVSRTMSSSPISTISTLSISPSLSTGVVSTSTPTPPSTTNPGTCIEGHLTCLEDSLHFATCTGGQLTLPQPIAPGFKCKVGSGVGLDISPV